MAQSLYSTRTVAYQPELFDIHPAARAAHATWSEAVPSSSHLSGISLLNPEIAEQVLSRIPLPVAKFSGRPRKYGVLANFPLYQQITEFRPTRIALFVLNRSNSLPLSVFANGSRCIEAGGRGDPHKEFATIYEAHAEEPWRGLPQPLSRALLARCLRCSDQRLRIREPQV